MTKLIITKIENIRRIEEIKYIVNVPRNVNNVHRYAKEFINENDYSAAKIKSKNILHGELLEENISKIEIFHYKNNKIEKIIPNLI